MSNEHVYIEYFFSFIFKMVTLDLSPTRLINTKFTIDELEVNRYLQKIYQAEERQLNEIPTCLEKFNNVDINALKRETHANPDNPNVMKAAECAMNSIYDPTSLIFEGAQISQWITKLQRIGSDSVFGIAMTGRIKDVNDAVIIKAARNPEYDTLTHELFAGLFVLNPLRSKIMNFNYIFGGFDCSLPVVGDRGEIVGYCDVDRPTIKYIMIENLQPAISMAEYITNCTPTEFLKIFYQLMYALQIAHETTDFTHYDLHTNNVLIRTTPKPVSLRYGDNYITTNKIATIIDFGTSHFRYKNLNYGDVLYRDPKFTYEIGINPGRSFPLYDVYRILHSCIYYTVKNPPVFEIVLDMMKYFYGPKRDWKSYQHQRTLVLGYRLPDGRVLEDLKYPEIIRGLESWAADSVSRPSPTIGLAIFPCQKNCPTIDFGKPTTTTTFLGYILSPEQRWDSDAMSRNFKNRVNQDVTDIANIKSSTPGFTLRRVPRKDLFTQDILRDLQHYVADIAKFLHLIHDIDEQYNFAYQATRDRRILDHHRKTLNHYHSLATDLIRRLQDDYRYISQIPPPQEQIYQWYYITFPNILSTLKYPHIP